MGLLGDALLGATMGTASAYAEQIRREAQQAREDRLKEDEHEYQKGRDEQSYRDRISLDELQRKSQSELNEAADKRQREAREAEMKLADTINDSNRGTWSDGTDDRGYYQQDKLTGRKEYMPTKDRENKLDPRIDLKRKAIEKQYDGWMDVYKGALETDDDMTQKTALIKLAKLDNELNELKNLPESTPRPQGGRPLGDPEKRAIYESVINSPNNKNASHINIISELNKRYGSGFEIFGREYSDNPDSRQNPQQPESFVPPKPGAVAGEKGIDPLKLKYAHMGSGDLEDEIRRLKWNENDYASINPNTHSKVSPLIAQDIEAAKGLIPAAIHRENIAQVKQDIMIAESDIKRFTFERKHDRVQDAETRLARAKARLAELLNNE